MSRYRVYLIGTADTSLRSDTPRFLVPRLDGFDFGDSPLSLPVPAPPESRGVSFIVAAGVTDATERLRAIEAAYPGGDLRLHKGASTYRSSTGTPTKVACSKTNPPRSPTVPSLAAFPVPRAYRRPAARRGGPFRGQTYPRRAGRTAV